MSQQRYSCICMFGNKRLKYEKKIYPDYSKTEFYYKNADNVNGNKDDTKRWQMMCQRKWNIIN